MRAALIAVGLVVAESRTIVVTGATGRTGSSVYLALQSQGVDVRGLIRDQQKARDRLGCDKCDESEGIFIGDITDASTMSGIMQGADGLVITTAPAYHCTIPSIYVGCHYYEGAEPYNISWLGVRNQVSAFASSPGPAAADRHVVLMSNTLTTQPNNYLDQVGDGHGCFYGLQGEVYLLGSGVPSTIIKASGLSEGEGGNKEILVGHDDEAWNPVNPNLAYITRGDVSRLLAYAAESPETTKGLRFDVTSKNMGGTPTTDVSTVFQAARLPWDSNVSSVV
jgi:hypothetical protein